ncbi:PsiF family protein [Siccirubricoccus sp. KC 17139]|uniref:PsiF family protein n=1 Tax=Siccirubricoccus soli TaxID=2899147 RepID=A0ABT1D4G0_9PROT|nr:PsiF family protein [Siccirubricoccus soli]MCO6416803.1 PsiF family protein [Siccirubricoccus soli]MCP2682938.1 PsiF family protein [Siccirubricoccus soli]
MLRLAVAAALGLALLAPSRAAAESRPAREPTAAQLAARERMRACNAEARQQSLRGDPRRDFMRQCLSQRRARPS